MKKRGLLIIISLVLIIFIVMLSWGNEFNIFIEKPNAIKSDNLTDSVTQKNEITLDEHSANKFINPIKYNRGGDPSIYYGGDGYYYFTCTEGFKKNTRITLRKAKEPYLISYGEQKTIWWEKCAPNGLWAPELFKHDGVWYIYYAVTNAGHKERRMFVLKCEDEDPINGTWENLGQITDSTNLFAIDGAVFENKGQLYYIWSGWESLTDTRQRIFIASMSNPYTLNSPRTCISTPTEEWETHNTPVNEGPIAMVSHGNVHLTFSGSQANLRYYALGMVTASSDSDLLDAASWKKTEGPVFLEHENVYAVGGNCFIKSKDGTEDWLVYHAFNKLGQWGDDRDVFMTKINWNGDTPDFGKPVPYESLTEVPSGSTFNYDIYEAEEAEITGASKVMPESAHDFHGFTGNGYVEFSSNNTESVTFNITVEKKGTYTLLFRYTNDEESTKKLKLSVNDETIKKDLSFPATNNVNDFYDVRIYNYTRTECQIKLNQGSNTIKLESTGNGGPWLDCLLIPKSFSK